MGKANISDEASIMRYFAVMIKSKHEDALNESSFIDRKIRKLIKFIYRKLYDTEFITRLHDELVKDDTIKRFLDKLSTSVNHDTPLYVQITSVGFYILYCTISIAYIITMGSDNILTHLKDYINVLYDINEHHKCSRMFIGLPAIIATRLSADDILDILSLSAKRTHIDFYDEFFNMLSKVNTCESTSKDNVVSITYNNVSIYSDISLPELFMDALGYTTSDNISKSKHVDAIAFINEYDIKNNTYTYMKLKLETYPKGIKNDVIFDDTETFAILILDGLSTHDPYRNKAVLLSPSVYNHQYPITLKEAIPDYSYINDIDIYNEKSTPEPEHDTEEEQTPESEHDTEEEQTPESEHDTEEEQTPESEHDTKPSFPVPSSISIVIDIQSEQIRFPSPPVIV
ncbi:truncated A-type inclusion protein [Sea otter poxvirus]|uniref:Truncated A-type inclusion protein n=1 Tax=Sea otter poxvirus TaxID=1416741 RepID=A0A2U9QHT1_9POXV|nr:truncated A-type inclusion protein [Sea otter poxvirus]AWU47160.1 truncated A-type inclusion protein [Sea otter poxvirus]